jgi:hypothetical protein
MILDSLTPIFAASQVANPLDQLGVQPAPRNLLGMRAGDMLLIMTIAVVLALVLVVWAVYFRKPKSERSESRVYKSRPYIEEREDGTIRKRKKHKRLRRHHRTRNPTLAEVGGLPPLKGDSTPPPI